MRRAADAPSLPPPPRTARPTLQGTGAAPATETPPTVEPAPPRAWRVTYEVLDADGTPRHHMRAEFRDRKGEGLAVHEPEGGPATQASFEVRGGGRLVVWSYQRGRWVSPWLDPPPSGERHLVVRLDRGLRSEGVLLHPDGVTRHARGLVKPWVAGTREPCRPRISSREALVGQDGRFVVEGLPPGPVRLRADGHDLTTGLPVEMEAEAGDHDVRVVLRPAGGIAFLVVDAATGRAVQRARGTVLELVGEEQRVHSFWSTVPSEDPPEARATPFTPVAAGRTCRYRLEAQGHQPSDVIEVKKARGN